MDTSSTEPSYVTAAQLARTANRDPATIHRRIQSGELKPDTRLSGGTLLFHTGRLPVIIESLSRRRAQSPLEASTSARMGEL